MLTLRTITSAGTPVSGAGGTLYTGDILWSLVDASGSPVNGVDDATGQLVVYWRVAVACVDGVFTTALWPTDHDRTGRALRYNCEIAGYSVTGPFPYGSGVPVSFSEWLLGGDMSDPITIDMLGYVTPEMFGAKGDGVTNDTAAVNSAFASGFPVVIPPGNYLIKGTLFYYDGLRVTSAGTLVIVSDADFVVDTSMNEATRRECAIVPISALPTSGNEYSVRMQLKIDFTCSTLYDSTGGGLSTDNRPRTPARFMSLRNSVIDIDCVARSSANAIVVNNIDFYRDNRNVKIYGSYNTIQQEATHEGGFWIRDVSTTTDSISQNVVVMDGTRIENNGADEALAFFTQLEGKLRGCGVKAAEIVGNGIGLGFVNLVGDSVLPIDFDVFSTNTRVVINGLRENQAAVKFMKCNPTVVDLRLRIDGFGTDTESAFYAGIRNTSPRADYFLPILYGCTVELNTATTPVSEVIGYSGKLVLNQCSVHKSNTGDYHYGAKDVYEITGGDWGVGALVYDLDTIGHLSVPNPIGATYNAITLRRGHENYGISQVDTDVDGIITIYHELGENPKYIDIKMLNNEALAIDVISYTTTYITGRVFTKTTNVHVGEVTGTFYAVWKAQA